MHERHVTNLADVILTVRRKQENSALGLCFRHPRIYTGLNPSSTTGAVTGGLAVQDGRICPGLSGEQTIDLPGAAVVPGFIDTHAHLNSLGGGRTDLELRDAASVAELLVIVGSAANTFPEPHWITGTGWQDASWPDKTTFCSTALDTAAPDRPVALFRRDRHALMVNTAALRLSGIESHTPDPDGGSIERDVTGQPTGMLVDTAMDLVTAVIPKPALQEVTSEAEEKLAWLNSLGITSVHEAFVEPTLWKALETLLLRGALSARVRALLGFEWSERPPTTAPEMLRPIAIKGFADGALGSRGAQLHRAYSDDPSEGIPVQSDAELRDRARLAIELDLQLAVHAIGDRAVTRVLDLFDEFERTGELATDHRWRIEHAQIIRPEDLPRLEKRCLATQPVHFLVDGAWAGQRIGAERRAWAYRAATARAAGAVLGFGSDYPIESADPRESIDIAEAKHHPLSISWEREEERLSRYQALDGYWGRAAFLAHDEHLIGRLLPGFMADFVCLSADPFEAKKMSDIEVIATYVGGQCVFSNDP